MSKKRVREIYRTLSNQLGSSTIQAWLDWIHWEETSGRKYIHLSNFLYLSRKIYSEKITCPRKLRAITFTEPNYPSLPFTSSANSSLSSHNLCSLTIHYSIQHNLSIRSEPLYYFVHSFFYTVHGNLPSSLIASSLGLQNSALTLPWSHAHRCLLKVDLVLLSCYTMLMFV